MTESSYTSESTATPPKLLDTGLDIGQSDLDSFGGMFENFGKRQSQVEPEQPGLGLRGIETPVSSSPTIYCGNLFANTFRGAHLLQM